MWGDIANCPFARLLAAGLREELAPTAPRSKPLLFVLAFSRIPEAGVKMSRAILHV